MIPWSTPLIVGLGAAGFLAGFMLMRWRYNANRASKEFYTAPETVPWLGLIALQTAFWAIVIGPLLRTCREQWASASGSSTQIVISILCILALLLLPILFFKNLTYHSPLTFHKWKLRSMTTVGALIGLLAILNMLLLHARIKSYASPGQGQITDYLLLQRSLQNQLFILGALIGLATLATGALRNAIQSYQSRQEAAPEGSTKEKAPPAKQSYPAEIVLLYGLFYTMLIALIYIPVAFSLVEMGEGIRNTMYPLGMLDVGEPGKLQGRREAIEKLLQLRTDVTQTLQAGIAILAPLASSIIAILLGKGR